MKILSIDTSSKNASVAILNREGILIELNNNDEKTHSQKLMPMVDEAFQKTNLSLDDIGLIVCCLGPGSFTGVRIGIATVKAFSDTKTIPCVGVSSLESLAHNLCQQGIICSLINAGHDNVYAGLFEIKKEDDCFLQTFNQDLAFLNLQDEHENITSEKLIDFIENNKTVNIDNQPIYFVGDAVSIYSYLLQNLNFKNRNDIYLADEKQSVSSGITLAKVGYTKYKNGQYGDSSILSPIYLRKSQAEIALEEKNKRNEY